MKRKAVYEEEREPVNFDENSVVIKHQGIHTPLHILTNQASLILLSVNQCLILSGLTLQVK